MATFPHAIAWLAILAGCTQPGSDTPEAADWNVRPTVRGQCAGSLTIGPGASLGISTDASGQIAFVIWNSEWTWVEDGRSYDLGIRFPNSPDQFRAAARGVHSGEGAAATPGLTFAPPAGPFLERFGAAAEMALAADGADRGTIRAPGAGAALAQLRACTQSLAAATAGPIEIGDRFGPADYPPEALRRGEQGSVVVRLGITPDGRVTGCTVTRSSGSAALDAATCRLARSRVRFAPAAGAAAPSVDARATWTLPR